MARILPGVLSMVYVFVFWSCLVAYSVDLFVLVTTRVGPVHEKSGQWVATTTLKTFADFLITIFYHLDVEFECLHHVTRRDLQWDCIYQERNQRKG